MSNNSLHLDQVDFDLILIALANQGRQYTAAGGDYFNSRAALVDELLSRLKDDLPAALAYEITPLAYELTLHEVTK